MSEKNNRFSVIEAAVMLLPAAGYYTYSTQLPALPVITGWLLLLSLILWKPLQVTDRLIIYFSTAAIAISILADAASPVADDKFNFMISLLRPELLVPFLFYLAAMITATRKRPLILGMCALAVCTAIAIGAEQQVLTLSYLPQPGPSAKQYLQQFILFRGLMIFYILLLVWYLRRVCGVGKAFGRHLITGAAVCLIFAGAWGLDWSAKHYMNFFRQLENILLQSSGSTARWPRRDHFLFHSDSLNINAMLTPEMMKNEAKIAFQVIGKVPPGYLRGRGYINYSYGGKWQSSNNEAETTMIPMRDAGGLVSEKIFTMKQTAEPPLVQWTVLPMLQGKLSLVFYPSNTAELHIPAEKAWQKADGTVTLKNGNLNTGYAAYAVDNRDSGAPGTLTEKQASAYRKVPRQLTPILQEIRYATDTTKPLPDAEYFRRCLAFFRDNFRYSLNHEEQTDDPVENFLQNTRRGHCELFASAMVLLLRQCGVPARYVTGFICEEPHHSGRSYVARMGNAHAWVEAYDRNLQKWVLLDPTPPTPPIPPREYEELYQWGETVMLGIHEFMSELRRGHIADAGAVLAENVVSLLARAAGSIWSWLLSGMLILLFWLIFRPRLAHWQKFRASPARRKIVRQYWRFLLRMWFTGKTPFFSRPTALEMERKLLDDPLPPQKQQDALAFLRAYRRKRYRP